MQISDILRHKQDNHVWTIQPDASVRDLLSQLAEHHIGAMIVAGPDGQAAGIVSERDVVRHLHSDGDAVLDATVDQIMTRDVVHCAPGDAVPGVAALMTDRRIRHLPVCRNERLVGLVSIGDLVKAKISDVEAEADGLKAYIAAS